MVNESTGRCDCCPATRPQQAADAALLLALSYPPSAAWPLRADSCCTHSVWPVVACVTCPVTHGPLARWAPHTTKESAHNVQRRVPLQVLSCNHVPSAAALYLEDMYVDYDLAQETAEHVRWGPHQTGCRIEKAAASQSCKLHCGRVHCEGYVLIGTFGILRGPAARAAPHLHQ